MRNNSLLSHAILRRNKRFHNEICHDTSETDTPTASFFSYVALVDLGQNLDRLHAHAITVDFHPVLIAGINNLSGNKPPWLLPAKARYLAADSQRAAQRVGLHGLAFPKDLMSMALTTSANRALYYVKANHPPHVFLATMNFLFQRMWLPPHVNLTKDDNLESALREATENPDGSGRTLFTGEEVAQIMAGRDENKAVLKAKTDEVVKLGAFGAPWLWVTNDKGESQSFFGSDRFSHIYKFLDVPFQDVTILPPPKGSKL